MLRAIFAIVLAAFFVSIPFMGYLLGGFWESAFAIILVSSLFFGIPALFLLRYTKWISWWQAVIVGGLIPQVFGLINSPIYIFVYYTGLGMGAGLTVWFVGMFRNPTFMSVEIKIPRSLVVAPLGAIAIVMYLNALKEEQVYGCITKYKLAENPTSRRHSIITVVADNGEVLQSSVPVGYSNPDILGTCAWGSKKRTANLQDFDYEFHSANSNGCVQVCGNSEK